MGERGKSIFAGIVAAVAVMGWVVCTFFRFKKADN